MYPMSLRCSRVAKCPRDSTFILLLPDFVKAFTALMSTYMSVYRLQKSDH